jgi:hypothetical protein
MVATDSYRLAERYVNVKANAEFIDQKLIVPARTVQELLRILSSYNSEDLAFEQDGAVKISISDNQILFTIDSVDLVSRLINGQYPDYKQIIPDKNKTEVVANKSELLRAVKAAAIFSKIGINDINLEVSNISNSYSDIFDSTAEVKARNDTIEWWVLFLLYINLDGKDYKPLFGDGTHEERIQKLEDLEDKENPFEIESIKKLSYLISFWFTARNVVNKVDFEAMDKLYVDTMSTYKIDETNTVKISDLTETKDNSTPLIQPIA